MNCQQDIANGRSNRSEPGRFSRWYSFLNTEHGILNTLFISLLTILLLAPRAEAVSATGGTVTNVPINGTSFTFHIFTNAGTSNLVVKSGGNVDVFMVGGGGGGSMGGGGAGGVIFTNLTLADNTTNTVTVGGGGGGLDKYGGTSPTWRYDPGFNGTNSVFSNSVIGALTAYGGGGGGCYDSGDADRYGRNGGCGGGGGALFNGTSATGGVSVQVGGYGSAGGASSTTVNGGAGGGGGAVTAGGSGSGNTPGNGGAGTNLAYWLGPVLISGTNWFAGGGGGGEITGSSQGTGGSGGGGNGGYNTTVATAGLANTGGGGGGGWYKEAATATFYASAAGGSGIVIVRYVSIDITVGSTSYGFLDTYVNATNTWSYTISGSSLTNNLTVSVPSSSVFTISSNNVDYGSEVVLTTNALGNVPLTNIWVRFTPTAATFYSEVITNSSPGAVTRTVQVTGLGLASDTPLLTVTPSSLAFGNVITNKTSANQMFTVTGVYLTNSVTVTAPSVYFELSTNGTDFLPSPVTLATNGNGGIDITNIYVRFTPSNGSGSYAGSIANSTAGAVEAKTVAVSGAGVVQTLVVSTPTLASFGYVLTNTTSATTNYTVSGSYLESDVTVTAPSVEFAVSTNSATGFGASCMVTVANADSPAGGTLAATPVYVRFTPTASQAYSGSITNASTGAAMQTVGVSGTGFGGKVWTGTAGTDWATAGNWSGGTEPTDMDDVLIDGGANQPVLNLSGGAVTIKSLLIGPTTASTLTFRNGNVTDKKLLVTGDVTIGASGTLKHDANTTAETHRLFLDVGGNLTINPGGKINLAGLGYSGGNTCPGRGVQNVGAGYGGEGGGTGGGTTYGSVTSPTNIGSCGYFSYNGEGGGAVKLTVAGALINNGTITVDGTPAVAVTGGGSGGSIYIVAGSMAGTGTNSANGLAGGINSPGGGGGRIAIVLTNADDSAFAGMTITAYGARTGSGDPGAAGTVYLKGTNNTYGRLVANNNGLGAANTTLIKDNSILMDSIVATNYGVITVGSGTTLDLTQGCTLRSYTGSKIRIGLTTGPSSPFLLPSACTFTNVTLSWIGTNEVSMTSDVTVASGAVLQHESNAGTEANKLKARIVGNLIIAAGGKIDVTGLGYNGNMAGPGAPSTGGMGAGHGGQGGGATPGTTYGSVTNPTALGSAGYFAYQGSGGGAVLLTVSGALTNNGAIIVDGGPIVGGGAQNGGGSGGSINIVAGSLAGTGTNSANGSVYASDRPGGGGGRIAIVLTNADDSAFANMTIRAYGVGNDPGSAGTVYLKGANQSYGRLIVDNNGLTPANRTLLHGTITDATVGDVIVRNSGKLALDNQTLTVNGSWSNAVGPAGYSGGTVAFAGTSPAMVWGGNTWSNLMIVTAGKIVSFEHSKTQTVYGIPAFSNVTLRSTLEDTAWHLRKSGEGCQDVGVVTVYDSNAGTAGTHLTFRGASGSVVSDAQNVNWDAFKPHGTMILLR